jgi:CRP-like cAMP-binding protein
VPRYVFSARDGETARQKALSAESRRKRGETWQAYREEELRAVLGLRQRGLVPLAIADVLGLPDETVSRHLRELEASGELASVPEFLSRELR